MNLKNKKTVLTDDAALYSHKEDVSEKEKWQSMSKKELEAVIKKMTKDMHTAAAELNFERAAELRDKILELKRELLNLE